MMTTTMTMLRLFLEVFVAATRLLPWPLRFAVAVGCCLITIPLDIIRFLYARGAVSFLCGICTMWMLFVFLTPPPVTNLADLRGATIHSWSYWFVSRCTGAPAIEVTKDVAHFVAWLLRVAASCLNTIDSKRALSGQDPWYESGGT